MERSRRDPDAFGGGTAEFHEYNARSWPRDGPHSLLATATHDTKRGEDFRARIDVLSELPDEWRTAVGGLALPFNGDKSESWMESRGPDSNDEYPALSRPWLGAWPADTDTPDGLKVFSRGGCQPYMLKAAREGEGPTQTGPIPMQHLRQQRRHLLSSCSMAPATMRFSTRFGPFQERVAFFGRLNSLSQVLLKLTSPGVPDLYQGLRSYGFKSGEIRTTARPVDFEPRRTLLNELQRRFDAKSTTRSDFLRELTHRDHLGLSKLFPNLANARIHAQRTGTICVGGLRSSSCVGREARACLALLREWEIIAQEL